MKIEEIKIGMWIGVSSGPARVLYYDDKGAFAEFPNGDRHWLPEPSIRPSMRCTPAELTSAGIPDDRRLAEQRSGTLKWNREVRKIYRAAIVNQFAPCEFWEDGTWKSAQWDTHKMSDATPEQISDHDILDSDIPDPLKSAVAKLREPQGKMLKCGLYVRVGDLLIESSNDIFRVSNRVIEPETECAVSRWNETRKRWDDCGAMRSVRDGRWDTPWVANHNSPFEYRNTYGNATGSTLFYQFICNDPALPRPRDRPRRTDRRTAVEIGGGK